ncbi:MAG: hypothetical protein FJ349_01240 [Sphingomonadales bacterium]|nr:hypothetical protein [Sphingomonadales bacterium]
MKKIILSSLLACCSQLAVAQVGNISQPEMQILYRGYDNKIIPNVPCGQQLELSVEGASYQKISWTDAQGQTQIGYNLRVKEAARTVVVKVNGLDEKGDTLSRSTQVFHVKAFPAAQLYNDRISKTSGMKASIGLGPDCPFTGVSFEVIGGSLSLGNEEFNFSGPVIPASYLNKVKPGDKVVVTVSYRRKDSAEMGVMICSAVLEVIP